MSRLKRGQPRFKSTPYQLCHMIIKPEQKTLHCKTPSPLAIRPDKPSVALAPNTKVRTTAAWAFQDACMSKLHLLRVRATPMAKGAHPARTNRPLCGWFTYKLTINVIIVAWTPDKNAFEYEPKKQHTLMDINHYIVIGFCGWAFFALYQFDC